MDGFITIAFGLGVSEDRAASASFFNMSSTAATVAASSGSAFALKSDGNCSMSKSFSYAALFACPFNLALILSIDSSATVCSASACCGTAPGCAVGS